jgi:replicative DNA helicase
VAVATEPGRLPPQDLDAERSALGAMLLSDVAVAECSELVRPEDFYRGDHAEVYSAILDLFRRSEPVDQLTVCDALQERGSLDRVGGKPAVFALTDAVPVAANAGRYATIVRANALLRRLIRAGEQIARLGYERPSPVDELVDQAEQIVYELAGSETKGDFSIIQDLLHQAFERIAEMAASEGDGVTGLATGFRALDQLLSGFQPSNLVVLAARPSMGKTSLALNIAEHVAVQLRRPVALFSLEMSKAEIAQRLMCSVAGVDQSKLRNGRLANEDWSKVTGAVDTLADAPLFIDDTGSLNVMEIRAKTRRLAQRQGGLGLIVIDYIQLMSAATSTENRVQEVSQISRALKVLGRELNVPVLALSQLSRAVEQRQNKRPMLSDLRESGSIEQDSDVVAFIYRDSYYRRGDDGDAPPMSPDDPDFNKTELIVAKHRNGPTGEVVLRFQSKYTRFRDDYRQTRSA